MVEDKGGPRSSVWGDIARILWDVRWPVIGCVFLTVAVYFAMEYRDVLFPYRRRLSPFDAALFTFFGGIVVWGKASEAHKRIEKLEEVVEDLQRRVKP